MILRALILRPLLREKTRTALTILGIAVGVAVVVAIQLANQSALRAFRESVDAIAGRANYQLVGETGPLDERVLLNLRPMWSEGVRFAPVIDVDGLLGDTPIRLLAVDLFSDLHFRDYRYARIETSSSEAPATPLERQLALFAADAIIVPAPFAREHNLRVGSRVAMNVGGQRRTLTVRGILEAQGPATAFNGSIVVCDISVAQRNFGMAGQLSRVDLIVPDERLLSRIAIPKGARIERPSRRNERVEKMLRAFRVNLFALAGVALLVGMFLVYNTVLISILRRRKDVGVLKTVGTAPRQIFGAFLAEGLVFGLAGSVLGIALGMLLASGILRAVGRTINTLYVTSRPEAVELTPGVIAIGIAVGTLLSLLSALQPSLEAARVRPNAMIGAGLQQRVAHPRLLAALAALLFIAAALVSQLPPVGGIAVAGYVAVLLVVAGFSLLAPMVVRATSQLFSPLLERTFGIVGRLAAASLPASLRRTSVASAALSLATGMMVAVALMVGSFRETVRIWVDQTVSSDLWLRPSKGLSNSGTAVFPPQVADELEKLPFIADVDRVRGRDVLYRDSIVAVGSGEFDVAVRRGDLPMVTPRSPREALRNALLRNGVVVSESFAIKFDKAVGDLFELPDGQFPITGIYRDYSNDRGVVVMDRALYLRTFKDPAINTIVAYLKPGITIDAARRELERSFGPKHNAFVVTNGEIKTEVMRIFDQTFMITYALLGVAIVVAVLGIVNTLSALILERTRELALLRVSGLSTRELTTMIVLESSLLGVASTAAGLVMGYALSWILIYVINKQSFGWTIDFHTPVALIAASLAVTLLSSTLAGLAPARLARSIHLPSAIKGE
ncbi:MAG: putative transport system permease protein [Acidobacteriota bacterium]|jgi:putative ABC transport system permease protein|nr:putative transport system permease protein [Acidobacteriota bacterium]